MTVVPRLLFYKEAKGDEKFSPEERVTKSSRKVLAAAWASVPSAFACPVRLQAAAAVIDVFPPLLPFGSWCLIKKSATASLEHHKSPSLRSLLRQL